MYELSRIEESTRTLIVLDVDGEKPRFNVKNTHTRCCCRTMMGGRWRKKRADLLEVID